MLKLAVDSFFLDRSIAMSDTIVRGKFIVIEGGEGSGKSTIINYLKKIYSGNDNVFTREPGGAKISEELRSMIFDDKNKNIATETQLLLFEAARAENLHEVIRPALINGKNVICDRFDASTYAYQICGFWKGQSSNQFRFINDWVVTTPPDLYIFCDIDPAVALKRRSDAGEVNHFDLMGLEFHERVYAGYKEFFANMKHSRVISIDTSIPIKEMLAQVGEIVREELE